MAKELHNIELSIAALGRSVFLGQLYSADSEVFHPTPPCWKEQSNVDNHTVKESHAITTVEYSDVQSLSDRAKVLDVSGEISISVMSGALSLKGSAKYLDSDSEKLSSREATVSSTLTQEVKRLTFKAGDLSNERYKQIKGTHATHVVTQIVYGGRVLAVFKESKTDSDKTKDISGEFSVEAVKKAGSKFSLEGEFKGKSEDRDLINKQDISVKVYADARLKNTPNTVVEALELVSTWSKTVQENGDLKDFKGVPLHITLTPLNRFIDTSVEMRVLNALAKAELDDIIKTYNGIVSLQGKRSALTSALEERRNLFPTLRQKSSEANEELENDVLLARQRLAEYMTAYRTGKPQEGSETVPSVANFLQGISKSMVNHRRLFLEHEEEYRRLEVLEFSATKGKAPLGDADALNTQMATGPGAIGLVIIPENFDSNSLQNMYRVALNRILAWREKEDKALADETAASSSDPRVKRAGDQKYKTEFLSFYADPLVTESLLRLNGDNQTLAQALSASRVDKRPLFVYFDFIIKNGRVFEKMEWVRTFYFIDSKYPYSTGGTSTKVPFIESPWPYWLVVHHESKRSYILRRRGEGRSTTWSWFHNLRRQVDVLRKLLGRPTGWIWRQLPTRPRSRLHQRSFH